jgi:hypothetical protein
MSDSPTAGLPETSSRLPAKIESPCGDTLQTGNLAGPCLFSEFFQRSDELSFAFSVLKLDFGKSACIERTLSKIKRQRGLTRLFQNLWGNTVCCQGELNDHTGNTCILCRAAAKIRNCH